MRSKRQIDPLAGQNRRQSRDTRRGSRCVELEHRFAIIRSKSAIRVGKHHRVRLLLSRVVYSVAQEQLFSHGEVRFAYFIRYLLLLCCRQCLIDDV